MTRNLASYLTVVLLLSASAASPALAKGASDPDLTRVVRVGDLDLSTESGVNTLFRRINNAAWNICRVVARPTNGPQGIENTKCRRTVIEEAVKQVNSPGLTARYTGNREQVTARR
jgi:UrcA family protein